MYRIFDAKNSEKVSKSSIHGITLIDKYSIIK